jgi:hypothetical protein
VFRRGLVWLPLACAPALAACSLLLGEGFTDTSTPTTNDSGGTTDGPSGGDGTTNPTGEGGNPQTDASLFDGGTTAVCASDAAGVFCDDFERSDPKGNWSSMGVNDGGILVIDKSGGVSRLKSAITAVEGAGQLSKDFAVTPKRMRIEVSLEIETLPSTGSGYIAGVLMLNPPQLVYLYAHGGGVFFVEQLTDGINYTQAPLAITLKTPHRIAVDVTFGGKTFVYVDGVVQVDKSTESFFTPTPPAALLGANSVDGAKDLSIYLDDYVFVAD